MDDKSEQKAPSAALRGWVRRARADCHMSLRELEAIADHIDAEMVELPKDADGVPIHVGDVVYLDDGRKAEVTHIDLMWGTSCIACFASGKDHDCFPSGISHTRPDSWERIANELDEMVDAADSADDRCEKLADLAERIRKLAAKEGER